MGAPPHEEATYDGDRNAFFGSCCWMSGRALWSKRLDAPLGLFTRVDTLVLGEYSKKLILGGYSKGVNMVVLAVPLDWVGYEGCADVCEDRL
jgi:hypothetical protein